MTNEKHIWREVYKRSTLGLPARRGRFTQQAENMGAFVRERVSRRIWFLYSRDTLRFLAESGMLDEFSIDNMMAAMRVWR